MITPEQHLDETLFELILEVGCLHFEDEVDKGFQGIVIDAMEHQRSDVDECGHFECKVKNVARAVGIIMIEPRIPDLIKDTVKRVFDRANAKVEEMTKNGCP